MDNATVDGDGKTDTVGKELANGAVHPPILICRKPVFSRRSFLLYESEKPVTIFVDSVNPAIFAHDRKVFVVFLNLPVLKIKMVYIWKNTTF